MDPQAIFDIGKRNYLALRKILWKAGILLAGEAVGGGNARTVRLEIGSGRLWLQEGGGKRNWSPHFLRKEEPHGLPGPDHRRFAGHAVVRRRVIELSGFELSACFEAGDGAEALDILQNEWVDAILTDINMPGMDGEELLRRLAADELLCGIPAIVVSTDATENRIARLMALGARGYVTKPFRPETLRAELERTLGVPCD